VTDSTLKPIVGIVVTTSPIYPICHQYSVLVSHGKGVIDLEPVKKCSLSGIILYLPSIKLVKEWEWGSAIPVPESEF
jgi:hypothetical protein